MEKINVFSIKSSPRLEYTLKIVFRVVLGIDFVLFTDKEKFLLSEGIKVNYTGLDINDALSIVPADLLFENGIKVQATGLSQWRGLPSFFTTNDGEVTFDLFSAVFFLVSRYEEYLPFQSDKYGRFEANQSFSLQGDFLIIPIVDFWCIELAKILSIADKCPNIQTNNYSFRLTIDVDFPWKYKNKGIRYTAGKIVKNLLNFQFNDFKHHLQILMGKVYDDGDNYEYLKEIEKRIGHSIRYFILCKHTDRYDCNLAFDRPEFRELVRHLDKSKNVGIHPSVMASESKKATVEEIEYLSGLVERKIVNSRQHYLALKFPFTYRNLLEAGIQNDYTLGYASQTGFRAGIARSFNFYDLIDDCETNLRIIPFQVMDRTLLSYLKKTPREAIDEFEYYTSQIRNVGGEFVALWHNDSLCDRGEWAGWKMVFEKMVELNEYI